MVHFEPETRRYTTVAIILHWAIALFIILNLSLGYFMEGFPPALRSWVIPAHVSAGISVLALTLVRVVWRLTHEPPPYPADMPRTERHAAHLVHFGLYVGMVLMPLTGWAIISAHPPAGSPGAVAEAKTKVPERVPPGGGTLPAQQNPKPQPRGAGRGTMIWGVVPLPSIDAIRQLGREPGGVGSQHELHDRFVAWHGIGGYVMIILLLLHIAGALKHQFVDRHAEFDRMGIRTRPAQSAEEP